MADLENFDGQEMLDKVQEKFNDNQNYVYIALAAIAIVAGGIWYYMKSNKETNLEADTQVWKTEFDFAKDSFNLATNGGLDEFGMPTGGLNAVADAYSGTDAANIAKYRIGVGFLNTKNFDAAITELKDVSFDDEVLGAVAKGALGDAYFEKGEVDNAISSYKKAVSHSNNTFSCPIYLGKLALAYETAGEAGDISSAVKAYERLKQDFPTSVQGREADKNIARLSK